MATHRLIGGRCHGMLLGFSDTRPEVVKVDMPAVPELDLPAELATYRLQYLAGGMRAHPCYAADGMDRDAIIERLLK